MAKKGGAPENLDPVRTKEEAKKRVRNGGVKSGEARRNKRDAKNAMNLLLDMAAKGQIKSNLEELGFPKEDQTNMVALQARLFTMAMSGNLQAYDRILKISGNDPEENRKERESKAADKRKNAESQARVEAMERRDSAPIATGGYGDMDDEDGETEDVIIFLPDNGRMGGPKATVRADGTPLTDTPAEKTEEVGNGNEGTEATARTSD